MSDSYIGIDEPTSIDKKLDVEALTIGANDVLRERIILSGLGATNFCVPVAHDAADAGDPLKIGGRARSSAPADVSAANDRVDAYFDMKGRLVVDASQVAVPITDNSGSITVDNGGTFAVQNTETVATSGGASTFHRVAAGSGDAANVKAGAGHVYGIDVFNKSAVPIYVKFHNNVGVPTPGASVVRTFGVQAGTRGRAEFPKGIVFSTGIAISIVTGIADNDATGVTAAECVVDIDYK